MAPLDCAMTPPPAVIPAKAGIHFDFRRGSKMDSGFRRNDEVAAVSRKPN
jgi:hypothetical protein